MTRKERKKKKKIQTQNRKLVKKYYWLKPLSVWTGKPLDDYNYTYTELDCMPDGWRKTFGEMMIDEINESLKKHNQKNFMIHQIKEKYGELRFYTNGCYEDTQEIINKYSVISRNVCLGCGKLDIPMIDDGWMSPVCYSCFYKGYRRREKYLKIKELKTEDEIKEIYNKFICDEPDENGEYLIPDNYKVNRFSNDGNKTITYDISDTVKKLHERCGNK